MRTFFNYLQEVVKEVFFLILFLLGIGSTISTYIPLLQDYTILKWFGLLCIFIGFFGANFRLYRKLTAGLSHQNVLNLIDELEYNHETLQNTKYSTAPALREEAWKSAPDKILNIPDALRTQLNTVYMKIRSAKEIHQSIQSVPVGVNTFPESIEIEKLLESAKQIIPDIIKGLKGSAKSGK